MAKISFDASKTAPAGDFEPIPAGRYNVIITDSDYMATKSGNGHYLKLAFKVLDGEYAGRMLWTNLNLDNPNPKAVEIAQRELSAICHACDLVEVEDSQELHNIPISGKVTIRPPQGEYAASNQISGFKKAIAAETETSAPWA